jgi:hypothetical protein
VNQLSKFLNHTLATHNQVDSFFENINHNDGKGAFTLTLFEMTITNCPGFHVPHCTVASTEFRTHWTFHWHNFIKMRYWRQFGDSLGETSVMITYIMIDYNDNKA